MLQVAFKFRHGCEFNRLSVDYPKLTMAHWCNFKTEFLELETSDQELLEQVRGRLKHLGKRGFRMLGNDPTPSASRVVVMRCGHRRGRTVDDTIESHGCIMLHPVVYHGGWENYRVISMDEKRLPSLFHKLEEEGQVQVIVKKKMNDGPVRQSFLVSVGDLLPRLTAKQSQALLSAVEAGYYSVPRKTSFGTVARTLGVPRTTFEEHVRKAEGKVINSVAPYVSLYLGGRTSAARGVTA